MSGRTLGNGRSGSRRPAARLFRRLGCTLASAILLAQASEAAAQELVGPDLTTFERDEAGDGPVAVRSRPQPAYDALGRPVGIFRLYPAIEIGPVLDSNLLVTPDDPVEALGIFVQPIANLRTDWSGGTFGAYAGSRIRVFPGNSTEDTASAWAGLRTELDIRRDAQLRLAAEAGSFSEDRISNFSPTDNLEPIQFERYFASATLDLARGRFRFLVGADADRLAFHDAVSRSTGGIIDQGNRDRTRLQGQVRVGYDLSPAAGMFAGLLYNTRDYDTAPLTNVGGALVPVSRDSEGGAAVAGFRLELNRLIRLRLAAGYLWQNYQAPLRDVEGLYASADLTWFVTELTTIAGLLRREVSESGSLISSGTLRTATELRVDHELRRNILLGAEAEYELFDFSGLDRLDSRFSVNVSGRYRANRWVEFNASTRYIMQRSSGAQATVDFNVFRLLLSATLRY